MSEDNSLSTPGSSQELTPGLPPAEPLPTYTPAAPGGARPTPQVTFMGNSYDLAAVIAVVTGGVITFSCITCNMGFYCLPFIPIILGVVGLLSAKDAVDPARTKLLSWLGIGGGALVLVLMILVILAYVALIVIGIAAGAAKG